MHIPVMWKYKCLSDYHWCAQLIDSLTEAEKVQKLNCGKPLAFVSPRFYWMYRSDCKEEIPHDEIKQEECFKTMILKWQTLGCMKPLATTKHGKPKGAKRAANLAPDHSDSALSICLALGAIFSLILVGVLLYCFFFRGQKQTSGRKAKGSSSKGASQTGKSKLGKSKYVPVGVATTRTTNHSAPSPN